MEQKKQKKQKKQILLIGAITVLLMLMAVYKDKQNDLLSEDGNLLRKEPGTGSQETTMNLEIPELDETIPYPVRIKEREYTMTEREELFQRAQEEINQTFPAQGETIDHITKPVNLPDTLADGMVSADWNFGDSAIMGTDGTIQSDTVPDSGTLIQVQVMLHYKSYECLYEFPCYVYPEIIDGKEALLRRLELVLSRNSLQKQEETEQILPKTIGGYTLLWKSPKSHTPLVILVLGVTAAAAVLFLEKEQKRRREELRKKQLQMEYPQMVAKMALLLGAGMTVRQAWERVCEGYERQQNQGNCKRSELYEQMQTTCRQMRDGVGESKAYEQFGERSGMSFYRRFAMLLVQNLQKGNAGLLPVMEAEANRAFEERKNNAKKYGEEAGTKLLLPMMIMMSIVIITVMVPAVMTMQI